MENSIITQILWSFFHDQLAIVTRKHFFKISSNSEAFSSELLENLEEMFHRYDMWTFYDRCSEILSLAIKNQSGSRYKYTRYFVCRRVLHFEIKTIEDNIRSKVNYFINTVKQ